MLLQTDQEFSTLSLHEATAEEKEEAEVLKNKGNELKMNSSNFISII